jgi:hypothetical protein
MGTLQCCTNIGAYVHQDHNLIHYLMSDPSSSFRKSFHIYVGTVNAKNIATNLPTQKLYKEYSNAENVFLGWVSEGGGCIAHAALLLQGCKTGRADFCTGTPDQLAQAKMYRSACAASPSVYRHACLGQAYRPACARPVIMSLSEPGRGGVPPTSVYHLHFLPFLYDVGRLRRLYRPFGPTALDPPRCRHCCCCFLASFLIHSHSPRQQHSGIGSVVLLMRCLMLWWVQLCCDS